ncbi:MAG TPA: tRNA (adenosine(37)-N6)-threonylcarbamoyltransferase complex dimerization subunit type 1 TsaB [Bacteroidales bacterium]|nr:tRNA (adenosine(37)-N6)-threonylcarbamoyltransferase complex dimerization subunit type 1 TsaB [Bacteroidales bacterium]
MSLILNIETATGVCSIALARDGQLIGLKESNTKYNHSSVLTLFMDEVLKTAGVALPDLDAVAVSEGPGSYTGLRIGVASAKGLCYALEKPMIGVSTLQAMAIGMVHPVSAIQETHLLYCPMIDARRMEVYCAIFDERGNEIRETRAEIMDENSFMEYLGKNRVVFAGDGALKCRPLFDKHPNAVFSEDFQASAKFMISLSEEKFSQKKFEDIAYFEPYYLKDFVAGKPRVKGLK